MCSLVPETFKKLDKPFFFPSSPSFRSCIGGWPSDSPVEVKYHETGGGSARRENRKKKEIFSFKPMVYVPTICSLAQLAHIGHGMEKEGRSRRGKNNWLAPLVLALRPPSDKKAYSSSTSSFCLKKRAIFSGRSLSVCIHIEYALIHLDARVRLVVCAWKP